MSKAPSSDDAVKRATGHGWAEWCRLLDRAGAKKMTHAEIAQMVHEKFGSGPARPANTGWWSQMVTVGYERLRGLRAEHERPDGFEISRTQTIDAPIARVYDAWRSPAKRTRWLADPGIEISTTTAPTSIRFKWIDGKTRASAILVAKGDKTSVTVSHVKIKDAKAAEKLKKYWVTQLASLAEEVG